MKTHCLHPVLQRTLLLLGVIWTLPNSLLGLLLGIAAIPWGARPRLSRRDFALVFDHWPWGPGGAMTLGNVIINTAADLETLCSTYAHRAGVCQEPRIRIGTHERAHVWQYMLLGPFFLPLYFALGGVSARNRLERAADRYALGQGSWWPNHE
ncbi:MAG: hypothetical protein Q4B94_01480 [Pseudomonadota bacterium]|nr:hypothetical protein [Pseudomonadota bacterium]